MKNISMDSEKHLVKSKRNHITGKNFYKPPNSNPTAPNYIKYKGFTELAAETANVFIETDP